MGGLRTRKGGLHTRMGGHEKHHSRGWKVTVSWAPPYPLCLFGGLYSVPPRGPNSVRKLGPAGLLTPSEQRKWFRAALLTSTVQQRTRYFNYCQ